MKLNLFLDQSKHTDKQTKRKDEKKILSIGENELNERENTIQNFTVLNGSDAKVKGLPPAATHRICELFNSIPN